MLVRGSGGAGAREDGVSAQTPLTAIPAGRAMGRYLITRYGSVPHCGREHRMTRRSGHTRTDDEAIRGLTTWLADQFPELSVDDVERAVHGTNRSREERRARCEFVPVLVDQLSGRPLATPHPPRQRA
jgi:hypothetical protein